ncbi:MAG: thiamine diphosphokinase [Ilumatobacteraceae bacterium]
MRSTTADGVAITEVVVVVTGAAPIQQSVVDQIPADAVVIACDGALDHALAAGMRPSVLVGDLDSVSSEALDWAERHATIDRFDPDKDHTDTELALRRAVDLNPTRLVLVSGGGDRLDHTLGAITALGHRSLTSIPTIDAWWQGERLRVVHGPGDTTLDVPVGSTISLLALHGSCTGVSVSGVRWPLDDAELVPGLSRGLSNETTGRPVTLAVSTGVLTVLIPDPSQLDADQPRPLTEIP